MFDEDISRRLAQGRNPVTAEMWNQFWERLGGGDVARAEAVNLLKFPVGVNSGRANARRLHHFIAGQAITWPLPDGSWRGERRRNRWWACDLQHLYSRCFRCGRDGSPRGQDWIAGAFQ